MPAYNPKIVKFATGIRKRNQGLIDNYYDQQGKAALIGSIGQALSGAIGAYGQRQRYDQQRAAAAQIGALPELGLSPEVAQEIAPSDLLRTALALRARNQPQALSALDQVNLQLKQQELADLPQAREQQLALAKMQLEKEQAHRDWYNRQQAGGGEDYTTEVDVLPDSALERAGYPVGSKVKMTSAMGAANINQAGLSDRSDLVLEARRTLAAAKEQLERDKMAAASDSAREKIAADIAMLEAKMKNATGIELIRLAAYTTLLRDEANRLNYGAIGHISDTITPQVQLPEIAFKRQGPPQVTPPPGATQNPNSLIVPEFKVGDTATGPNGERIQWDGKEWRQIQ